MLLHRNSKEFLVNSICKYVCIYVGMYVCILEKEMATHSSVLAGRISGMEEPGGLLSMGSHRVRQDSATSLSLFTLTHWRRKRQPTPVFLPGESQGWGSLVGCRLWGCTELDMTEATAVAAKDIFTYFCQEHKQRSENKIAIGTF